MRPTNVRRKFKVKSTLFRQKVKQREFIKIIQKQILKMQMQNANQKIQIKLTTVNVLKKMRQKQFE